MDSPITGNPAQRKSQVQSIANEVFDDGPDAPDDLERGNHPMQASQSSVLHGQHSEADNQGEGESHEHKSQHQHSKGHSYSVHVCPDCGEEFTD